MTASTKGENEKLLSRTELAVELGVHPQTVQQWTAAGCPVRQRGRHGKPHLYRFADVREWLDERELAANSGARLDLTQERARKESAQATLAELKIAEAEGSLLPREQVEKAWASHVAAVRARLLAWSTTLADQVHRIAVLEGVNGVESLLNRTCRQVLTELSELEADESPAKVRKVAKKARKASKTTKKKRSKRKKTRKKKK